MARHKRSGGDMLETCLSTRSLLPTRSWCTFIAALCVTCISCGQPYGELRPYPLDAAGALVLDARRAFALSTDSTTCTLLDESLAVMASDWLVETVATARLARATIQKSDKWRFEDVVTVTFDQIPQRDSVIVMSFYLRGGKCRAFTMLEAIE